MKPVNFIFYFFSKAWENFVENPFLNSIAVGIISVTLFLFCGFMLIVQDFGSLFEQWGKGVRIVAFMQDGSSPNDRERLIKLIQNQKDIKDVYFVSKAEALNRFKKILKNNAMLLQEINADNPLPESLEIEVSPQVISQDRLATFATWLAKQDGVQDVAYGQDWLDRFTTALQLIKFIGFFLAAAMVIAALFIISNTIRVTLFARKDELEIMQIVGATNLFIKAPYVIEGSLQGLIGACVALLGLFVLHRLGLHQLREVFTLIDFSFFSWLVISCILLGGMILGATGSLISVGRFLKG